MATLLGRPTLLSLIISLAAGAEQILLQVAGSLQMYVDPLPQMPKLYGYSMVGGWPRPVTLTIGMFQKKWKFHRDLPPTTVYAFGTTAEAATFPGPTIEALQGVPLCVTWQNNIPGPHKLPWDASIPVARPAHGGVPTVTHLHGGVHQPQSDGNPFAWFTTGHRDTGPKWSTATYTYANVQHPGNLWYHDHALGLTRENILAGLLGAYVIRNPHVEAPFCLPAGGELDRHLILADRSFAADGSIYMNATGDNPSIHPQWQPEYFGDAITVNGKAWPHLAVQRRKYRFRIINASNARYLSLSLSGGLRFVVVGSDSSYLPRPVAAPTVLVAPAEIFDVVIDFSRSTGAAVELTNAAPYPYPTGTAPGGPSGRVMRFDIARGDPSPPDTSRIPPGLVRYYPAAEESTASKRRYITLYEYESATGDPTHLYINGMRLEDPVTETPRRGTAEVWEVINLTADNHPLHIHLATFQAVRARELVDLDVFKACMERKNDAAACDVAGHAVGRLLPVPEYEKTWKNVVKIEPGYMTTVVVQFRLVDTNAPYPFDATAEPGYVYHCHILDHEDNAMIRPLKLIP